MADARSKAGVIVVRCRCGKVYQADPAHAGRKLRCKCGREVPIRAARPGPAGLLAAFAAGMRRRVSELRHPGSRKRARGQRGKWDRWIDLLPAAYLAVAVIALILLWGLGDVWWPATVFLFGPRWLLLLPLIVLIPLSLVRRRGFFFILLGALIVIGPVMGLHVGMRNWFGAPAPTLRFMTFNVENGANLSLDVLDELKVDVATFEECGSALASRVQARAGWHSSLRFNLCFLSRWPITAVDSIEPWDLGERGFSGYAAAYTVQMPNRTVHIVNVHLDTPQKGLAPLRAGSGLGMMTVNTEIRDIGSNRTRNWVGAIRGPLIVAGDFNMPAESRIFRRYWSGFTDAFSQAGHGFGGSRVLPRYRVRIDHILMGDGWRAVKAFVGPDLGSDHLPVIADIAWVGK